MFVNLLSFSSMVLYFLSSSLFVVSCVKFSMGYHAFPHSRAAFKCTLYNSLFNVSFLIHKNLIFSFRQRVFIFPWVIFVAGEVYDVFILV